MGSAVMGLVRLIQTKTRRIARILLGGGLITFGVGRGGWQALVGVGSIAIFAGLVGVCFAAPVPNIPLAEHHSVMTPTDHVSE